MSASRRLRGTSSEGTLPSSRALAAIVRDAAIKESDMAPAKTSFSTLRVGPGGMFTQAPQPRSLPATRKGTVSLMHELAREGVLSDPSSLPRRARLPEETPPSSMESGSPHHRATTPARPASAVIPPPSWLRPAPGTSTAPPDRLATHLPADSSLGSESALAQLAASLPGGGIIATSPRRPPTRPTQPPGRVAAARLIALLDTLLAVRPTDWEWQAKVHDAAFAEAVLQVAVGCAERGEALQRLRRFYGTFYGRLRELEGPAAAAVEEAEQLRSQLSASARTVAEAEAEAGAVRDNLVASQAALLRLKLLRVVHGRQLQRYKTRTEALEEQLKAAESGRKTDAGGSHRAAGGGGGSESSLVRPAMTGGLKRASFRAAGSVTSGIERLTAEVDSLKRQLAAREDELQRVTGEKEEVERALRATEHEASALMAGIEANTAAHQAATAESQQLLSHADEQAREKGRQLREAQAAGERSRAEMARLHETVAEQSEQLSVASSGLEEKERALQAVDLELTKYKTAYTSLRHQRAVADRKWHRDANTQTETAHVHEATQTEEQRSGAGGAGGARGAGARASRSAASGAVATSAASSLPAREKGVGRGRAERERLQEDEWGAGTSRRSRLVTAAYIDEGHKEMPLWMLHKIVGTMLARKVEADKSAAGEDEKQELSEFIEDRFVELFGLKSLAAQVLRDMTARLSRGSARHPRLSNFRRLVSLVPGDVAHGRAAVDFFLLSLRCVVEALQDDFVCTMRASTFWRHFSRPDVLRIPVEIYERCADRLAASVRSLQAEAPHGAAAQAAHSRRLWSAVQALECFIATLDDVADLILASEEAASSVAATAGARKVHTVDVGAGGSAQLPSERVCLDTFLERALSHWVEGEERKREGVAAACRSWDMDGNGKISVDEFTALLRHANPEVSARRATSLYMRSLQGDTLDHEAVGRVLLGEGLQLLPRPAGLERGALAGAKHANGEADGTLPSAGDARVPCRLRAATIAIARFAAKFGESDAEGADAEGEAEGARERQVDAFERQVSRMLRARAESTEGDGGESESEEDERDEAA